MGLRQSKSQKEKIAKELKTYADERVTVMRESNPVAAESYLVAYNDFCQKHEELLNKTLTDSPDLEKKRISDEAIEKFVSKLLSDPEINMHVLPDAIEHVIYRKVLRVLLGTLLHIADTSDIEFIGHRLILDIVPIEK